MRGRVLAALALAAGALLSLPASADTPLAIRSVAEKKVRELPPGPLYWRVETFPGAAAAAAAAGPMSLVAEVAGKTWLFTLGAKGGSTPGGAKAAEIGPVPVVAASEYLLRINNSNGPPGAITPVHTHPGSEAFYVLAGRLGQRMPHGVSHVDAGRTMNGHGADTPMQVFSAGTTELNALVMFLVDANRPFNSPAKFD